MYFVTSLENGLGVLPINIPDGFYPNGIDGNKITLSNLNGEESFTTIPAWEGQRCVLKHVKTDTVNFHIIEVDPDGDHCLTILIEGGGGYWWLVVNAVLLSESPE